MTDLGKTSSRRLVSVGLSLLTSADRRKFALLTGAQMSLAVLDLLGVLLIGAVAALGIAIAQDTDPPASVTTVAAWFGISNVQQVNVVVSLAVAAALILLVKTAASAWLSRRTLLFLARRQALIGARLARGFMRLPMLSVQSRSSQEVAFALTTGVRALTLVVLGNASMVLVEASLLVILSAGLLVIDPVLTLVTVAFFGATMLLSQRALSGWAHRLSRDETHAEVASVKAIQEATANYRLLTVTNRIDHVGDRFESLRWNSASANAGIQFVSQIPKFTFEAALVVGGFLLCLTQFALNDAATAVGSIALFLAASSRVTPSLLRLQGSLINLKTATGIALPIMWIVDAVENSGEADASLRTRPRSTGLPSHAPEGAAVRVSDVTFAYPDSARPAVNSMSLMIEPGESVALVGPTGCGKSTLADLVLGLLRPDRGVVSIDDRDPAAWPQIDPNALAYVPQEVRIVSGSVRENVALGLPLSDIDDVRVWHALEQANLAQFLRTERTGLETLVGEHGVSLSGGQRQRIGIARALYCDPRLLVLDEATSALDAETEKSIADAIYALKGRVTVLVIAHRLATVRDATRIAYLEGGKIVACAPFDELRRSIPQFDRLASLNRM